MTEVVLLDLTGEISMAFSDRPLNPKTLQIEKKIAGARLEVYKVYSSSKKSVYALKIYPKNTFGTTKYQNEKLMIPLRHQNVIRSIPIICNDDRFNAILTEFAHHGDFFDLVTKGLLDTEVLMRTYFHHLIEGLEYIHSNGLAHLDIKLENLMLGADFRLKIIDFDQAQPIVEEQILSKGTSCSRAPEVIDGTCRDLAAADIYSAGIILFAFKAGVFPFLEIDDTRKGKHLRSSSVFNADNTRFWRMKAQMKGKKTFFCKDFISLMNGMLHFDVGKRFKVSDIKSSKWYKGTIVDDESLQTIMKTKLEELKKKEEAKVGRF